MSSCSTSEKTGGGGGGCGHDVVFDGASPGYRRALKAVIAINAGAFVVVAIGSWLATGWPDLAVGVLLAAVFLRSAWQIMVQARRALREAQDPTRNLVTHSRRRSASL